jgi:hypothetical protein
MSKFREKAEAQTEQVIGQMLGDELLIKESQERLRNVDTESGASGGQHAEQGIVLDERGQEQPSDKARARQVSRVDKGGDPPGKKV